MKTRWLYALSVVVLMTTTVGPSYAQQAVRQGWTPWTDPEVVQAMSNLRMSKDQFERLRDAVTDFLDGAMSEYVSMMKQQKPDIPRRMKQAVARHARKMDKEMKTVLDDDQYKLYEQYRTLLTTKTGRMFSPSRTRRR
ncbi:MAG: hypothetical protein VYC36_03295 [Pseudomonadota bacterium]|uniref:Uncharacterized protein n=1 Tax=marine metagenome TaxID=408172 RepID=A0A381NHL8_9ZZZZ|nr:hypothetical protein [Pseudomonadota bacterium]HBP14370.1 hypothetical protein [Gammaproteobacteria bacterium]|tara:strand:+ start:351 stop:764 length:414 start_codon:yes stop_codon:yes gene_type:complete